MEDRNPTFRVAIAAGSFLAEHRDKRYLFLRGGAGSAKSWSVAAHLVTQMGIKPGLGILALRKTKPAVKTSCLVTMKYWLNLSGMEYRENKSEMTITLPNRAFVKFDSIDDVEKKKSIEGINIVWLEESTAFTEKEVRQLDTRCRANTPNVKNQLYFSFNPVDQVGNKWLHDLDAEANTHLDINGVRDSASLVTTHRDNPFMHEDNHRVIEKNAGEDKEYSKIYRYGQWAVPTHIIYTRWDVVREMTQEFDDVFWGLDFGYVNECALIELRFLKNEVWERQHIYESGLTNPDLIVKLKTIIKNKNQMIIADSAEPKTIQEIRNAGFNIHGCKKGPDSVRYSIRAVQSVMTHLCEDSPDLIDEKRGYKWKVDKDDHVIEGEPVKFHDHCMDAERYAIMKVRGNVQTSISFAAEEKSETDIAARAEIWDDFQEDY